MIAVRAMIAVAGFALLATSAADARPRCYHDHAGRVLCTHGAYEASPYYRGTRYRGHGYQADFGGYDPTLPTAHYVCDPNGTNCRWERPGYVLKDY